MILLPRKMRRRRRKRRLPEYAIRHLAPPLAISQILAWADAWHASARRWPLSTSGKIPGSLGENWRRVDSALRLGLRGLPGKSSLALLLAEKRGVRNATSLPKLTLPQILAWADAWKIRTGAWPDPHSGPIPESAGETWLAIHAALVSGGRGLVGGSTLVRLLARSRGRDNPKDRPNFTIVKILRWADAYHARTRRWPTSKSGPIAEAPSDTWHKVDSALAEGWRGVGPGSTLAQLLSQHRGARNTHRLPPLRAGEVWRWAREHKRRTGSWPNSMSGAIPGSSGETWAAIAHALHAGRRGLKPFTTIGQFIRARLPNASFQHAKPVAVQEVLKCADAFRQRTGHWPTGRSGNIAELPGINWKQLDNALADGRRGLGPGSSLAKLLAKHRGTRNRKGLAPLSIEQILAWADVHRNRTGQWPQQSSGSIPGSNGETWASVHTALARGSRGVAPEWTLPRLLAKHRGVRNRRGLPLLNLSQIRQWARAHQRQHGRWPTPESGVIPGAGGETWTGIQGALLRGRRGVGPGLTLARLRCADGTD